MKKTLIYNANNLILVKIVDKSKDFDFIYKSYKKGNWLKKTIQEGVYYIGSLSGPELWTKEEIENSGRLIIDNVVYLQPSVKLVFKDRDCTKNFLTYEEACDWGREQAKQGIEKRITVEF